MEIPEPSCKTTEQPVSDGNVSQYCIYQRVRTLPTSKESFAFSQLDPALEAFFNACKEGDLVAVGATLSEGKIDPSAYQNLALKTAISERQYQIVSLLLLDKRVDPSMDNNKAFKLACEAGDVLLTRVLLSDPRVDPSADDDVAFKTACASGHNEVIKLLLTDDRIDPSAGSNHGIKFAAENGHDLLVQTLLNDSRVDPADDDNAAIKWAATAGHVKTVSLLLKDPRVEPQAAENYAFRNACENGHLAVVSLLIADKRVNPADQGNYAIKRAARNGHTDVVKLLLADKRVDPAAGGNNAINWVARNGHLELVKILMQDERVDPSDGNLAVTWAAESEQVEVIRLLLTDSRVIKGLESSTNPLLKRIAEIVGETTQRLLEATEKANQISLSKRDVVNESKKLAAENATRIATLTKEGQAKDELAAQLNIEIAKLTAELENRNKAIEALQDQNPEKGQELLKQLLQSEEKDAQFQKLQDAFTALQNEHQATQESLKQEQEANTQLKEQNAKLESELNEKVTTLQNRIVEIKKQGENTCTTLRAQVVDLEAVVVTKKAEIVALKKNIQAGQTQMDEKDKLVSHLVEQVTQKNASLAEKDNEVLEHKQEIASLQESKLALANQFNTFINRTKEEQLSLAAAINDLKQLLEAEKTQTALLQKKLVDSDKLIIGYVAENGEKGREIIDLKSSLATLEYGLKQKVDQQEVSLARLENDLEVMTKSRNAVLAQLEELKASTVAVPPQESKPAEEPTQTDENPVEGE